MNNKRKSITIELSEDEILIIHNTLANVCWGPYEIEDWEFHSLIGVEKKQAEEFFERFKKIEKENNI